MANEKQYLEVFNDGQDDLYIRDKEAHEGLSDLEDLVQDLYAALTQSDIVPVQSLPASPDTRTVYRVTGTDTYTDYMYYGGNWILLAEYNGQPITEEDVADMIDVYAVNAKTVIGDPVDDWDPGTAEEYFERIQSEVENLNAVVNAAQLEIGAVQTDLVPTEGSANHCTSGTIYTALLQKLNVSDLPTKVSVFQNDAGYLTQHQDISGKADYVAVACLGPIVGTV